MKYPALSGIYLYVVLLSATLFLTGCGKENEEQQTGSLKIDSGQVAYSAAILQNAPDWFKQAGNLQQDSSAICAVATAWSRRPNLARDKAVLIATRQLAEKLVGGRPSRNKIGGADGPEKKVLSADLSNSTIREQHLIKEGKGWRAYVMLACTSE